MRGESKIVDCIFTHIFKAFERVKMDKIIKKNEALGFENPFLAWISSYLIDHTVLINNVKSPVISPY